MSWISDLTAPTELQILVNIDLVLFITTEPEGEGRLLVSFHMGEGEGQLVVLRMSTERYARLLEQLDAKHTG